MGVSIQELTPELAKSFGLKEPRGVPIADVVKDSPADRAGLASGDVLMEFDGKRVDTPQDLQKIVAATAPGKGVPVRVWRDKGERAFEIKLGEAPEEPAPVVEPGNKGRTAPGPDPRAATPDIQRQRELARSEGGVAARAEDERARERACS